MYIPPADISSVRMSGDFQKSICRAGGFSWRTNFLKWNVRQLTNYCFSFKIQIQSLYFLLIAKTISVDNWVGISACSMWWNASRTETLQCKFKISSVIWHKRRLHVHFYRKIITFCLCDLSAWRRHEVSYCSQQMIFHLELCRLVWPIGRFSLSNYYKLEINENVQRVFTRFQFRPFWTHLHIIKMIRIFEVNEVISLSL